MSKEPYCLGLLIGEIKHKKFELGLEGTTLIVSMAKKKATVDEKTEQLVLYGKDVFFKSVIAGKNLKIGISV